MKKVLLLLLLTITYSSAAPQVLPSTETKKTFDGTNGWWWYEEEVKDPKTDEVKVVSYKVSPAEKKKIEAQEKTNKLLQMLIIEQKENKKLNKKILEKLIYAFPRTTPKYSINKKTGKKCLTNSSMDCFVMPVIAEGQNVPALKMFLKNPSPKNSKNWLQWQATYFNHVNKVSKGLHFAYLKDGVEAYPTSTDYTYGDNLFESVSENMKVTRENEIIKKYNKDLAYLVFIGETSIMEDSSSTIKDIVSLDQQIFKEVKKVFIFPSQKAIDAYDKRIKDYYVGRMKNSSEEKAWKKIKKIVRPDLYKKRKIRVTPTTIIYYKNEEMDEPLYQTIEVGNLSLNSLRTGTISFLEYNSIIDRKERSADKNWNTLDEDALDQSYQEIPKSKKPIDFDSLDEEGREKSIEQKNNEVNKNEKNN